MLKMTKSTLLVAFMLAGLHQAVWAQGAANEVYLDDRENHSWSYYSDPSNPVRSLNPADVKITYYGYGTNTMYSSNAATPSGNPDVNVAASQVGIGIDAPGKNTYVYLKTLERRGGTTATSKAAVTGPCKYRVIPNPFSIRPTYGSGDTRWRGFYRWRVKRLVGGAIYTDLAKTQSVTQGQMVDPEQLLWLAPTAEYGMEIDLEAIWARAFVFTATEAATGINAIGLTTAQYATGPNAHERNEHRHHHQRQRDRAGLQHAPLDHHGRVSRRHERQQQHPPHRGAEQRVPQPALFLHGRHQVRVHLD